MKRAPAIAVLLAFGLAGCGRDENRKSDAAIQQGIDRSVADVRAANAAAAAPAEAAPPTR